MEQGRRSSKGGLFVRALTLMDICCANTLSEQTRGTHSCNFNLKAGPKQIDDWVADPWRAFVPRRRTSRPSQVTTARCM